MNTPIVNITSAAAEYIKNIIEVNPGNLVKAGYDNSGCSGHKYTFEFIKNEKILDSDVVIDNILVISVEHTIGLIGSTLDLESTVTAKQLIWHNPSALNPCGCGESFQIECDK